MGHNDSCSANWRDYEGGSEFEGFDKSAPLQFEACYSIGSPGIDAFGSFSSSKLYSTGILRTAVNSGIKFLNTAAGYLGIDKRLDLIPNAAQAYPNNISAINQSANGGFVLYPNRPNTNMLERAYSK